jgi:hypothetical protein
MSKVIVTTLVFLALVAGTAAFIAYFMLSTGFVASQVWLWHAVPLGLPVVPWTAFAVLPGFLFLLRGPTQLKSHESIEKPWGILGAYAAMPWLILFVGWALC